MIKSGFVRRLRWIGLRLDLPRRVRWLQVLSLAFSHRSKDPWTSWFEQEGEAAIGIWGGRGRFRRWGWRRGYLLCFWGFLGLMWICGFDVLDVHRFLLLMKCSWISGFMLLWIFVSIFLILFWWCSGVFIKLNHFCIGISFFFSFFNLSFYLLLVVV